MVYLVDRTIAVVEQVLTFQLKEISLMRHCIMIKNKFKVYMNNFSIKVSNSDLNKIIELILSSNLIGFEIPND